MLDEQLFNITRVILATLINSITHVVTPDMTSAVDCGK